MSMNTLNREPGKLLGLIILIVALGGGAALISAGRKTPAILVPIPQAIPQVDLNKCLDWGRAFNRESKAYGLPGNTEAQQESMCREIWRKPEVQRQWQEIESCVVNVSRTFTPPRPTAAELDTLKNDCQQEAYARQRERDSRNQR
jgi:hypothetical protein